MVPANTRTRLTLPTYGSDVVFTTSASSGASEGTQLGMRSAHLRKDLRQRMFHRRREAARGNLEQFQGADAGAAADRDDREERPPRNGPVRDAAMRSRHGSTLRPRRPAVSQSSTGLLDVSSVLARS